MPIEHGILMPTKRRRDEHGRIIYDAGVTLLETWRALERLVDEGRCKSIGLSDVSLGQLIQ
jgi:diketogulonate reductase-like aldo/keto reductase